MLSFLFYKNNKYSLLCKQKHINISIRLNQQSTRIHSPADRCPSLRTIREYGACGRHGRTYCRILSNLLFILINIFKKYFTSIRLAYPSLCFCRSRSETGCSWCTGLTSFCHRTSKGAFACPFDRFCKSCICN